MAGTWHAPAPDGLGVDCQPAGHRRARGGVLRSGPSLGLVRLVWQH